LSLGIPRSNFNFIEQNFADIIEEVRNGANGLESEPGIIRKTIIFRDFSKMHCIEMLRQNEIELYWYDWYDDKKELIMKFHAHYHPEGTPAEIKMYDPYHFHAKDDRFHNESFRELNSILEFIRVRQLSLYKQ
jgi:hypothetical protein